MCRIIVKIFVFTACRVCIILVIIDINRKLGGTESTHLLEESFLACSIICENEKNILHSVFSYSPITSLYDNVKMNID